MSGKGVCYRQVVKRREERSEERSEEKFVRGTGFGRGGTRVAEGQEMRAPPLNRRE